MSSSSTANSACMSSINNSDHATKGGHPVTFLVIASFPPPLTSSLLSFCCWVSLLSPGVCLQPWCHQPAALCGCASTPCWGAPCPRPTRLAPRPARLACPRPACLAPMRPLWLQGNRAGSSSKSRRSLGWLADWLGLPGGDTMTSEIWREDRLTSDEGRP